MTRLVGPTFTFFESKFVCYVQTYHRHYVTYVTHYYAAAGLVLYCLKAVGSPMIIARSVVSVVQFSREQFNSREGIRCSLIGYMHRFFKLPKCTRLKNSVPSEDK